MIAATSHALTPPQTSSPNRWWFGKLVIIASIALSLIGIVCALIASQVKLSFCFALLTIVEIIHWRDLKRYANLNRVCQSLEKIQVESQTTVAQLQTLNQELTGKLTKLDAELFDFRDNNQNLTAQVDELRTAREELSKEIEQLQGGIKVSQEILDQIKEQIFKLTREVDRLSGVPKSL